MKKLLSTIIAVIMAVGCIAPLVSLAEGEEAKTYPTFINGYADGTFRPDATMTRAEAANIFSILSQTEEKTEVAFADVTAANWYFDALSTINAKDMLHSYSTYFEGDKNITRIELCEFLYILKNGYNASMTQQDMFAELVSEGIIKGYEDGSYRMYNNITRAEAVALIQRALGIPVKTSGKCKFGDVLESHWAYFNILTAASGAGAKISGAAYPQEIPADYNTKVFDTYNEKQSEWTQIQMINDDLRAKGVKKGGEGAQRMNSIAISADGQVLIAGNDTATLHRSIDGGKTWLQCKRGFYAHGGHAFAIDPNNSSHIIGFGSSSNYQNKWTGLYLSTDAGETWDQTLNQVLGATWINLRECLCFDATSLDEESGESKVAYWSKLKRIQFDDSRVVWDDSKLPTLTMKDKDDEQEGLWKTTDGGRTWSVVNSEMSDGIVKVNPENGTVYVANLTGFYRSTDGGVTFEHILSGSMINSLDVIATRPNNVYITDHKGVLISEDSGKTFKRIPTTSYPASKDIGIPQKSPANLKVSPQNPDKMVLAYSEGLGSYVCRKYYSHDGGVTWAQSNEDASKDFLKSNWRETMYVWDPNDENKVWGFGGDWVVSSTDGGKSFIWDYEGGNAYFVDQRSMFNIYNPDIFYFGSQDFHGAMTTDYGENWKYVWKVAGENNSYAGYVYGSYAADENTLIALETRNQPGQYCRLRVSRDAGETWVDTGCETVKNNKKKWSEMGYQSPTNPDVLFMSYFRSPDFGYTWEEMPIEAVYTHNPYGRKELYGAIDNHIKVSYDDGATWEQWADVPIAEGHTEDDVEIWDMSFDGVNNIMYYVSGYGATGLLFGKIQNGVVTDLTDNLYFDENGTTFQLCAVDPRYTQVIYVGGYGGDHSNGSSVQRSCDGGKTFQLISTVNYKNSIVKTGESGGSDPYDLIVHPVTGELWVPQMNGGWAKFPPPYDNN